VCDLDSGGGPGEGLASCGYFRHVDRHSGTPRGGWPGLLHSGDPAVEAIYDPDLDRYFLDLPLNGARSRHSLRAHGYDILVWVRFLGSVRGKTVWQADADDVGAYYRARRRSDAEFRISASTWNRAIASLDKLYRWAERSRAWSSAHHLPTVRSGEDHTGRRAASLPGRNEAYERAARRSDVRFVDLADYQRLPGRRTARPDRRGRPSVLEHVTAMARATRCSPICWSPPDCASKRHPLLAAEIPVGDARAERQRRVELPAALTKGDRGRSMLLPRRLLPVFDAYIAVERAEAVAKFASAVAGKPSTARSSSTPLIRADAHCISLAVARWTWRSSHRMNAQGLSFAMTMERHAKLRSSG
jgi:hypothetical protein